MRSVPLAVLLATLLASTAPVTAQVRSQPAPDTPPLANGPAEVEEAELQQFTNAVGEIRQLRSKWMPQVEQAAQEGGPDAALQVQDTAYAEMVDAVEAQGLSLRRYNQIASLAQN